MEVWLAKAIVMVLLMCVAFVCGLLPARLFRGMHRRCVNVHYEPLIFLPRDAMLYSAVYAVVVCLSACVCVAVT